MSFTARFPDLNPIQGPMEEVDDLSIKNTSNKQLLWEEIKKKRGILFLGMLNMP